VTFKFLWSRHLLDLGLTAPNTLQTILDQMADPEFGDKTAVILSGFLRLFVFEKLPGIPVSPAGFFTGLFLIGITPMAISSNSQERLRILATQVVLLLGFVLFVVLLLISYRFVFSWYEGSRLASFHRYLSTFAVFWTLVTIGGLALISRGETLQRNLAVAPDALVVVAAIALVAPVSLGLPPVPGFHNSQHHVHKDRLSIRQKLLSGGPPLGATHVYSLWNGTNGYEHFMATYELKPMGSNFWCFALGSPRNEADVWSCNAPAEQFLEEHKRNEYDALFLGQADQLFVEEYGADLFVDPRELESKNWFSLDKSVGKFIAMN
jgi:hypothetical protein